MGKRAMAEHRAKQEYERMLAELPELPPDAYRDERGLLRRSNGDLIPDGEYRTPDGGLLLYEGNFEASMGG